MVEISIFEVCSLQWSLEIWILFEKHFWLLARLLEFVVTVTIFKFLGVVLMWHYSRRWLDIQGLLCTMCLLVLCPVGSGTTMQNQKCQTLMCVRLHSYPLLILERLKIFIALLIHWYTSQSYKVSPAMWHHSVIYSLSQVNTLCLNLIQTDRLVLDFSAPVKFKV